MRLLCFYFPRLAVNLALRQRPGLDGKPLVLIDGVGDKAIVTAASGAALSCGAVPGLTAGDARRRIPAAVFAPDNAADCLAELERLAAILRLNATPNVALASREHLFVDLAGVSERFPDEGAAASRLASLVKAWSGLDVRAGVASTRAEALQAARAARRFGIVSPEGGSGLEPPVRPMEGETLAACATFDVPARDREARARLVGLFGKLSTLLDVRGESFREARIEVRRRDYEFTIPLRPSRPLHAANELLGLLSLRVPNGCLEGALALRVVLDRLGPAVRQTPLVDSTRFGSRPGLAAAASLRRAS